MPKTDTQEAPPSDVSAIIEEMIDAMDDSYITGERQAEIVTRVAAVAQIYGFHVDPRIAEGRSEWVRVGLDNAAKRAPAPALAPTVAP